MSSSDVTFQHAHYIKCLPQWELVEDAANGEYAVKAKKEKYLLKPNKTDTSAENQARYEQYTARAVYYNATGRTLAGLAGLAFGRWPEMQMPAALDAWKMDVTGAGVPLVQHAQTTLSEVMKTGRGGILVDYPQTDGSVSVRDQQLGGIQPTMTFYPAAAITNWRTEKRGSKVMLSMVVLQEMHQVVDAEGFGTKSEEQYRVLRLDAAGSYMVEIWRKQQNARGELEWMMFGQPTMPTQGNGQRWTEIPFQFVGAKRNDWSIDPAPMYDIAVLNIAHYRNSADYEDSCYFAGQPQFFMAGLDEAWVKMLKEMGIYVGSRQILPLPMGGTAGILQAEPNSMPKEAMDQKERQMAALGARLLTRGSGDASVKTKAEVDSDDATAHSVLSLACDNVSMAYTQAIKWAANFAKAEGEVEFSISTEFGAVKLDAQTMVAMMQAVQQGQMPLSDFWTKLREAGFIDSQKTDEEILEEIRTQTPPTDGALDDDEETADQGAEAEA
jgi:hypothetical protein